MGSVVKAIQGGRGATVPRPRNDQVIIREEQGSEEKTAGGVIVPGTADNLIRAVVVAVGPGGITSDGKRVPLDISVGDHVRVQPGEGSLFMHGGQQLAIVPDHAVVAVLQPKGMH